MLIQGSDGLEGCLRPPRGVPHLPRVPVVSLLDITWLHGLSLSPGWGWQHPHLPEELDLLLTQPPRPESVQLSPGLGVRRAADWSPLGHLLSGLSKGSGQTSGKRGVDSERSQGPGGWLVLAKALPPTLLLPPTHPSKCPQNPALT